MADNELTITDENGNYINMEFRDSIILLDSEDGCYSTITKPDAVKLIKFLQEKFEIE